jgi:hypothetical protein
MGGLEDGTEWAGKKGTGQGKRMQFKNTDIPMLFV